MSGDHVALSVVICTHNRANDLRLALESLTRQDVEGIDFEVLVVDNRSSDATPQVVADFVSRLPIRGVRENTLGLAARNRGWRESKGDIVAYLDDDALADAGWLQSVVVAFQRGGERVGAVGGRVAPIWEAPRPAWLADRASLGLTIVDWGDGAKVIHDLGREWLVGANVAFRRAALEQANGFHPSLDRVGTHMLSGGDVFLERVVQRLGYDVLYEPSMRVQHRVPPARLTKEWFRRRYFWQGASDAVVEMIESSLGAGERLARAGRRMRALLAQGGRLRALARDTNDPAQFEENCWTWIALGHVAGLLGVARR